jgi:hypothetical protein
MAADSSGMLINTSYHKWVDKANSAKSITIIIVQIFTIWSSLYIFDTIGNKKAWMKIDNIPI